MSPRLAFRAIASLALGAVLLGFTFTLVAFGWLADALAGGGRAP